MHNPSWLKDAVVYEIYPQSFCDSNGDGIGDVQGIISKLDYVRSLNANAIWLNPCFESPFQDAGYDVTDYCRVAPRYGTNDDLKRLFDEAHKRGMHVLLDLVAGHTSIEHPWFKSSMNDPEGPHKNTYIWSNDWLDAPPGRFINGYGPRNGNFMINFFYCQPALNYGFCPPDPQYPWQLPMDHPDVMKVRELLRSVMKFWLDMGCDGFRVDMAASLVRGENAEEGIKLLWHDYRSWLDKNYPEAVLVSEWSHPSKSIDAGFHVDFMVHFCEDGYTKLFRAEKERIGNCPLPMKNSFFDRAGLGDALPFVKQFSAHLEHVAGRGYVGLVTGNHDIGRLRGGRPIEDDKLALAFLLLLPGVPFIYAGDEIGMDNVHGLAGKEGSYNRAAARTPMQWDGTDKAGFSTAEKDKFYLPLHPDKDRPNVADQEKDENSILNFTRRLLALRKTCLAAGNDGDFTPLFAGEKTYPLVYGRKAEESAIVVAVNPSGKAVEASIALADAGKYGVEEASDGVKFLDAGEGMAEIIMPPASFAVFRK